MISLFDTSSLLNLVRFYLPFDNGNVLKDLVEEKIRKGEFLVLDKVLEEARNVSRGIIITELPFITKKIIKTDLIIPNTKFRNLTENQFCDQARRRLHNITDTEFDLAKNDFYNTADAKLMLYANQNKAANPIIVTEETSGLNDSKLFKKIPVCCKEISVDCCNITYLIKNHLSINIHIN